ncbi:MAG: DUF1499 domain-containing protein [Legionellales bacterium]|nr:DUF1499 domain-containing protein [Legionellales bacterium]
MKIIYIFLLSIILLECTEATMKTPIDFKKLQISNMKPNHYLICPKNTCQSENDISPIYKTPAETLYNKTISIIQKIPRTQITYQDDENYTIVFVQKTKIFRFPDYIDIQIFSIDNNKSTIAIFSRAKYGYYDFGVNKNRVFSIITALSAVFDIPTNLKEHAL